MRFLQKHQPNFTASRPSVLCSAHFEESSFTTNLEIATSLGMKRKLEVDTVPKVDVAGVVPLSTENISDHKRRGIKDH